MALKLDSKQKFGAVINSNGHLNLEENEIQREKA